MFKRPNSSTNQQVTPVERVTSVLGPGINWSGDLSGSGGIRIEGTFEGKVLLRGLLVIGETGRVTCENVVANTVIVAGAVRGNIISEKLEIRSTGRVWGDVITMAFSTEEGSFLRGQIQMEDTIDLTRYGLAPNQPAPEETMPVSDTQDQPDQSGSPKSK
jgi:cytoskeletal protein CcmA (bactofilin family)